MPAVGRVVSPLLSAGQHDSNWEYLFRFVAGYWLNGVAKTDSTFLRDATTQIGLMRAGRWSWLAWWKRSAIRLTSVILPIGWLIGMIISADTTAFMTRVTLWVLIPLAIITVVERLGHHTTRRDHHKTLSHWYSHKFNVPIWQAQKMVSIPRGHTKSADKVVTIWWPLGFSIPLSDQEKWAELVANMLSLNDPQYLFNFTGRPFMSMSLVPKPPSVVSFEDFRHHERHNVS